MKRFLTTVALVAAAGVTAAERAASAQAVNCADLPNPVYLKIGDTQQRLIKELGEKLRHSTAKPLTLIYETSGSCTNINAIYSGTYKITAKPFFIPLDATENGGVAWDPSKASPTCNLPADPVNNPTIDIANSALFTSACPEPPVVGDGVLIKEYQGPNQSYVFVVPETSTQTAITAKEAYFVFGFGMVANIAPWVNDLLLFIRPVDKSTLLALAANIRVPGDKWKGKRVNSSDATTPALGVVQEVSQSATPDATIGILGSEVYDNKRDILNALAFKSFGQYFAYYPDSTASAKDKANVRDGHYVPWSPTVWLTRVDPQMAPLEADARYVIDLITGTTAPAVAPDFDPMVEVVSVGLIPECAMHVSREFEGGDLSLYESPTPCDCFYDAEATKATPAACVACSTETPCASGVCRHGFCEAR